jgi:3-methyladenine DNA glycosylase AlkC
MAKAEALIKRVQKTKHGFTDIKHAAEQVMKKESPEAALDLAKELLESPVHQARMLAAFILGHLGPKLPDSLKLLRQRVSRDPDWRVQEILAQAFDQVCKDVGYEANLPMIREWLHDDNPSVRRAASEGLRVWTARSYFRDHPDVAIRLLSALRGDESEYVRKSVGNALRDISRKHKSMINAELKTWDVADKKTEQTHQLARKAGK